MRANLYCLGIVGIYYLNMSEKNCRCWPHGKWKTLGKGRKACYNSVIEKINYLDFRKKKHIWKVASLTLQPPLPQLREAVSQSAQAVFAGTLETPTRFQSFLITYNRVWVTFLLQLTTITFQTICCRYYRYMTGPSRKGRERGRGKL